MEPLGVVASILTILGAASSVSRPLWSLITPLRGVPKAILTLNNEVPNLQLFLFDIHRVLETKSSSIQPSIESILHKTLHQPEERLRELDLVISAHDITTGDLRNRPVSNRIALQPEPDDNIYPRLQVRSLISNIERVDDNEEGVENPILVDAIAYHTE